MRLVEMNPTELQNVKLICLRELLKNNWASKARLSRLLHAPVDDVLDVLFRHVPGIALNYGGGSLLITPQGVAQ